MKDLIARDPVVSFFGMAFLFSWIAVSPLLLNPALPVEPFQMLGALAGPTLASVIVTAVLQGRDGLRTFFQRYIQWRAGVGWWLFILFGILLSLNLFASFIVGASVWAAFLGNIGQILPAYLITLIAGVILGPLWEEPGWRGFALPRLQQRAGPLGGTILLGVLWAVWHLPGYLGGWMGTFNVSSLLALIVGGVAFSLIATWIYNNTRGSILLMILLHSSSNAAIAIGVRVLPTDLPPGLHDFVFSGWLPPLTYSILALIILLATRGTLSYRQADPPVQIGRQPAT